MIVGDVITKNVPSKNNLRLEHVLRLQGKLTKTLTKLYDGLVDNLRTTLKLVCPGKALAKITSLNLQWVISQLFSIKI